MPVKKDTAVEDSDELTVQVYNVLYTRWRKQVTPEKFHEVRSFLHAAKNSAIHESRYSLPEENGGFYLSELLKEIVNACLEVMPNANMQIGMRIPNAIEDLKKAEKVFGKTLTPKVDAKRTNTIRPNNLYNRFVEYLYQGLLWNDGKLIKCPWHGKKPQRSKDDTQFWICEIIMPFLRKEFKTPGEIRVGVQMLKDQKGISSKNVRLADDKEGYQWDQFKKKMVNAWKTMARRGKNAK